MEDAYIVDIARSPIGKFLGSLSEFSAVRIGTEIARGLLARNDIKKETIEEAIVGNVLSAGLGQNPAKQVAMYAGLNPGISTLNVNKVCASGLKAISIAAEGIQTGNLEIVIAGGMESMTNAAHTVSGARRFRKLGNSSIKEYYDYLNSAGQDPGKEMMVDELIHAGLWDCYADMHMGSLAEKIGIEDSITREEQDKFALESHKKAAMATDSGKFKDEIIPIKLSDGRIYGEDEGIRRETSMEKLAQLKPAFEKNGMVTAGNASQISDGASFALIMSGRKIKELGVKPLAKIESHASSGIDPSWYGYAPITAMNKALDKAGYALNDMDLVEINEAFCVQVLGVVKRMNIDTNKLNVNGGATAMGHPLGASGAIILGTLIYSLKDRKKNLGIASLCHGGGGAEAMVVSRVE